MRTTRRRMNPAAVVAPALLLLALGLRLPSGASAQWTTSGTNTTTTNNVGVGSGVSNPTSKLEVGGQADNLFRVASTGSSATDTVANFTSAAGNIMIVRGNGNVGFGTMSPQATLHVQRDTNGDASLYLLNAATGASSRSIFLLGEANSNSRYGYLGYFGANYPGFANSTVLANGGVGGLRFYSYGGQSSAGGAIIFNTAPVGNNDAVAERMRLDASGHVGIGTANPSGRLHLTYGTNAWYFLSGDSPNNKGMNAGGSWSSANGTQLTFNAYGGGTELITEIGPNYAVHGASGTDRYAINGGKKAPIIQLSADAGSISLFGESGSGAAWRTPTLNLGLHVSSGGSVGVGTATPGYKLDVAGQVRSSSGGFVFPDGTVQATAAAGGGQWSSGSGSIYYNAGRVGVGAAAPLGPLSVGDSSAAGSDGYLVIGKNAGSSQRHFRVGFDANFNFVIGDYGSNNTAGAWTSPFAVNWQAPSNSLYINSAGNVGLGTAAPAAKLEVNANSNAAVAIKATGAISASGAITGATVSATYQDVAEWVPSTQELAAGTVVVLDAARTNHVLASSSAYDTKVAGVVSAQPGLILGVAGEGKVMVATTGRVKVKADATRGPIRIGDLIVTSDVEGMAMRSAPVDVGGRQMHAPGTIIGKALEPLEKGTGEILVLLSLQ